MSPNLDLSIVNKFVLKKQQLTNEKPSCSIVATVKAIGGLHATGAFTPYLSLFARVRAFRKEDLDRELYVKRTLGKIRYVRTTLYVLPRDWIAVAFAATRMMTEPASEAYSKFLGITEKQYIEASGRIVELLKSKDGMSTRRIKEAFHTPLNVSPVVNLMCDQGLLIRGMPEKGRKNNLHTYHLFNEYFSDVKLDEVSEEAARQAVVRWYLASFGPATENDVAWWTGFPKSQVRNIMESMKADIAYIDISDLGKTMLMLSSDKPRLEMATGKKKPVINLLPSLDPYLMGYKDRERYIDTERYNFVFDRGGNATSTILLDGKVIGIWDFEDPVAKIFLFQENRKNLLKEIHSKAKALCIFISGKHVVTKECESMTPLTLRTAGGVMSPLKLR